MQKANSISRIITNRNISFSATTSHRLILRKLLLDKTFLTDNCGLTLHPVPSASWCNFIHSYGHSIGITMIIHLSDHLTFWIIILSFMAAKTSDSFIKVALRWKKTPSYLNNCNILTVSCSIIIMNHLTLSKMWSERWRLMVFSVRKMDIGFATPTPSARGTRCLMVGLC